MDDNQLRYLLNSMDVPKHRYSQFNKVSIEWLYKHLADRNKLKPKFDIIMNEITHRFEDKVYRN